MSDGRTAPPPPGGPCVVAASDRSVAPILKLVGRFPQLGGSRQIFDVSIEMTSSSCGTGVPIMTVESNRGDEDLEPVYAAMSADELGDYWIRKNTASIDGYPTHIFAD